MFSFRIISLLWFSYFSVKVICFFFSDSLVLLHSFEYLSYAFQIIFLSFFLSYLFTLSSLTLPALVPYPSLNLLFSHVFVVSHSSSVSCLVFSSWFYCHCPCLLIFSSSFMLVICQYIFKFCTTDTPSFVLLVLLRLLSSVIFLFFP